jgi:prevent-host-death family protein
MSAEAVRYNMHDPKTHLSRIIERVERGEEIIVDRAGTPVAKVVPLVCRVNRTAVGFLAGQREPDPSMAASPDLPLARGGPRLGHQPARRHHSVRSSSAVLATSGLREDR